MLFCYTRMNILGDASELELVMRENSLNRQVCFLFGYSDDPASRIDGK